MNKNLLLEYIESNNLKNKEYYDFLKEAFDQRFYYYGGHFLDPFEKKINRRRKVKIIIISIIKYFYVMLMGIKKKKPKPTILSSAYFNVDQHLTFNHGLNSSRPPWKYNSSKNNIFDYKLFRSSNKLDKLLHKENFSYLISDEFIKEIDLYRNDVTKFIVSNNIVALFVSNDIGFFEKLYISIFKELNLPTFVFVHGLQFWLNESDFNRADYLVVWGKLSKQDFIKNGVIGDKIIISGHPKYKKIEKKNLKFDFSDILVLGNSMNGTNPSNDYTLTDRSNCIYYLYLIQNCLLDLGVKKVRFRPHPSENKDWYKNNINSSFFQIDYEDLDTSLNASTLVIGPTSTVFLESLIRGVNYVIFNPPNQYGLGLNGYRIPSIYNGDNKKVPVAKSVSELREILIKKNQNDITILDDICDELFNLEPVYSVIKEFIK
jgi:hypothetical protein